MHFGVIDEDGFLEVGDNFLRQSKGPRLIRNDDFSVKFVHEPLNEVLKDLRPDELEAFMDYGATRHLSYLAEEGQALGKEAAEFVAIGAGTGPMRVVEAGRASQEVQARVVRG